MKVIWQIEKLGGGYNQREEKVSNCSFKIFEGESVALMGSDNSGRKLLLRMLAGLRPTREGTLEFMGENLPRLPFFVDWDQLMPRHLRRQMGICLEQEGHLSNVSIQEGLEILFRFQYGDNTQSLRDEAKRVVNKISEEFGLGKIIHQRPYALNNSELRLAGLARAFLSDPSVVLLENPSQDVGDSSRHLLWHALEYIGSDPTRTVLISTDDWAVAWKFCKRWIVMEAGTIIFDGLPSEFIKKDHDLVKQFRALVKVREEFESQFKEAV